MQKKDVKNNLKISGESMGFSKEQCINVASLISANVPC